MNTCTQCSMSFKPKTGSYGKFCSLACSALFGGIVNKQKAINRYNNNPKLCKNCKCIIPYERKKTNQFCNSSCAGFYTNSLKDWSKIKPGPAPNIKMSPLTKIVKIKSVKIKKIIEPNIVGPYTKIYLCTCKITGIKWYSPTVKTIHPSAISTRNMYAYQCRFTFSIRKHPEWFSYSIPLIKEFGWYSAANKGNNLSGCSRDHMYSVSEGYKNNIDPKIISHPANCQVVPHRKNQSKNKKSSITIDELFARIKLFNDQYNVESAPGI